MLRSFLLLLLKIGLRGKFFSFLAFSCSTMSRVLIETKHKKNSFKSVSRLRFILLLINRLISQAFEGRTRLGVIWWWLWHQKPFNILDEARFELTTFLNASQVCNPLNRTDYLLKDISSNGGLWETGVPVSIYWQFYHKFWQSDIISAYI